MGHDMDENIITGRKKKQPPCCVRLFKEFSSDSSIHGIKYLSDENRHWTEKTFWSFVMLFTMAMSSYLVYDTFTQWYQSPVLVTLSERYMNIWEIPFPAITICPTIDENLPQRDKSGKVLFETLTNASKISDVKWRKDSIEADLVFHEILTDEGFCYTFNMMNFDDLFISDVMSNTSAYEKLRDIKKIPPSNWTLQEKYQDKNPSAIPFRGSGSGKNGGLSFKITQTTSDVYNEGYKVAVHLPCEMPRFDKHFYRFPSDKTVTLFVHPTMIDTENLQYYKATTRQCYFKIEKQLKFFKTYTRSNCQIECLIEQTKQNCSCIPSYLPQIHQVRVCNETDKKESKCVKKVNQALTRFNMEKNLQGQTKQSQQSSMECDCLPACTSLSYNGEISYSNRKQKSPEPTNLEAKIAIMFKDEDFMYSKRRQVYTFTEFLANFGGILGLFMGVSMLSFIEILYFLMFRQY